MNESGFIQTSEKRMNEVDNLKKDISCPLQNHLVFSICRDFGKKVCLSFMTVSMKTKNFRMYFDHDDRFSTV